MKYCEDYPDHSYLTCMAVNNLYANIYTKQLYEYKIY